MTPLSRYPCGFGGLTSLTRRVERTRMTIRKRQIGMNQSLSFVYALWEGSTMIMTGWNLVVLNIFANAHHFHENLRM